MKPEYDFSQAEQGKFYRPPGELQIPIYLDGEIRIFYQEMASQKNLDLDRFIHAVLRKEMEFLKEIG